MICPAFPQGMQGVIFDCDGVLIESRQANEAYYNRILAHLGLPPMTASQESHSFMATVGQTLKAILPPELHPRIPEAARAVDYVRDILPLLSLQPGLLSFLDFLRDNSVRMAVHTNRGHAGMQCVLDFFALAGYFDQIVTAQSAPPKPSPEGTADICARWGLEPRQVCYLGDSPVDRQTARGAGVVFVAFNAGSLEGDIQVPDFPALRRILEAPFPASGSALRHGGHPERPARREGADADNPAPVGNDARRQA
ncbi:MAG: HAD family hydrolase [Desulfovibrio sp.]|jgi:phosphoglycolate phosphatase-like HAD superfamily hydrolase|nr:HAD family hydrolase [Desulfovibrio sp.]